MLDPSSDKRHTATVFPALPWCRRIQSFVLGLMTLGLPCQVLSANWPAWRGNGSGLSAETNLPTKWDAHKNVLWKTKIAAKGHSSPIIWENRIFLTGAREQPLLDKRHAILFTLSIALAVLAGKTFLTSPDEHVRHGLALRTAQRIDRWGTIFAMLLACVGWVYLLQNPHLAGSNYKETAWDYSGIVGIISCVAAIGFLPVKSIARIAGSVVLAAALIYFVSWMPHSQATRKHYLLLGASCCVLAWWGVLFLRTPGRADVDSKRHFRLTLRNIGSGLLMSASLFGFVTINCLNPYAIWTRVVTCVASDTGEVLWEREGFRAPPAKKHLLNSYATPTAVSDGRVIVAQFDTGLLCLDFQGREKWRKPTPKRTQHIHCGMATSPIIFRNSVIYAFLPDGPGPRSNSSLEQHSELTALDKETGELKWRIVLPGGHDSYNTPLILENADKPILLIATWGQVLAYDPSSGAQIQSWRLPIAQCIPSIVATPERAYVMSGRNHGSEGGFALELELDNKSKQPNIAWKSQRTVADIASPVLVNGLLFMVNKSGIASCLAAGSGKVLWKKRLGKNHFSSPIAGDGKVYFTALDGTTTMIAAERNFVKLAKNSIDEEVVASHAISNGKLFIRGAEHLFCIDNQ